MCVCVCVCVRVLKTSVLNTHRCNPPARTQLQLALSKSIEWYHSELRCAKEPRIPVCLCVCVGLSSAGLASVRECVRVCFMYVCVGYIALVRVMCVCKCACV